MAGERSLVSDVGAGIRHVGRIHDAGLRGAVTLPTQSPEGYPTDMLDLVYHEGNEMWVVSRQAFRNYSVRTTDEPTPLIKNRANTVFNGLAEHIRLRHIGDISDREYVDHQWVEKKVEPCKCSLCGFRGAHFATLNLGSGYYEMEKEVIITPQSLVEAWKRNELKIIPVRSAGRFVSTGRGRWQQKLVYGESDNLLADTKAFPLLISYVMALAAEPLKPQAPV